MKLVESLLLTEENISETSGYLWQKTIQLALA